VQIAIYDKDSDDLADSALVATSNTLQISSISPQWHEHTADWGVIPTKTHILGVASDFISGIPPTAISVYYDTVGYNSRATYSLSTPISFPNPLGTVAPVASSVWSIYGEFTPITEAGTIESNAYVIDAIIFTYDTTLTFPDASVVNRNAFDIKLKHSCNHNLSGGQFILSKCPRCLGTGFYYDAKFNAIGTLIEVSLEDKLQQALEKFVLTEENKFHNNIAIDLKQWLGELPIPEITAIIKYDLLNMVNALRDTQKTVAGLSPRAQIASIDDITVTMLDVDSLHYTITLTTVSGETANLRGTTRLSDLGLTG